MPSSPNPIVIIDNATIPQGEFATVTPQGVLGVLQFWNGSSVPGVIELTGSNDTAHFGPVDRLKADPGETKIDRVTLPVVLKFFNPIAAFGPCTISLKIQDDD